MQSIVILSDNDTILSKSTDDALFVNIANILTWK